MNQSDQDHRRAADKAFSESLEQLQDLLELPDNQTARSQSDSDSGNHQKELTEADELEQAAADIEEYMQKKTKSSENE
ncbi:hypothetical protein H6F78_25815 [Coleofasciculus sp. FACHB-64]|uniref:hypothetical protein n=1 Tax=Cyanophyceae TaxID=3028117 RepID=UPI0016820413|nr:MULTISPECIES: hypothetical protein [unclassified Coleofasciculus]MBD1841548.1 hypothetical protein [Coleofasciculus sp. FACHB-501]MBD2048974.1 hypothetical protein [Coleofasciculus sp. FACHB-64]